MTIERSFPRTFVFVLVLVLAACLPRATFANGPLALCQPGQPFLWPNGGLDIPYNPDQGDLGPLSNADATALVASAFAAWDAIPTASTTYKNAGQLPEDVDITNFGSYLSPSAPDGLSAIVFDDTGDIFNLLFGPGSGILGFAGPEWGNFATCEILEGVAFINGGAMGNQAVALDVLVHEFGHYQNLAHTVVNGQLVLSDSSGPSPNNTFPIPPLAFLIETMYPFYFGPAAGTSTPHRDDVAGLSTLYPAAHFAATTGAIAGRILGWNGFSRLTGINVIARNIANPFVDAVSAISSDFTDDFTLGSPLAGRYTFRGLTPGASYAVYIDRILAGSFSTPPLGTFPGPEEFYNGAAESGDGATDDPRQFTPVSAAAGATVDGVDILFNAPPQGAALAVGDDGSAWMFLPFTFKVCGEKFEWVHVNANGSVTFGTPSTAFSESRRAFLSGPARAAGLWDDLNPAAGGSVSYSQTAHSFTATWSGVPEWPNTGANTFSIKLHRFFGTIDVSYGAMSAIDGLAGVSCGGKGTSRFEGQQDLSRYKKFFVELLTDAAGFEVFSPTRPFDLAHTTLRYTGTLDYSDRWAGENNSVATAKRVSLPFSSAGALRMTELESTGDVDYFKFTARAGQVVAIEVLTGQLDTLVGLFDTAGNLFLIDDDSGDGDLSRLLVAIPFDLDLVVGVTTFPDFGFAGATQTGRYVLSIQAHDQANLIAAGDDTSTSVPLGFSFPFQGQSFDTVFVNSNGNLTFGAADPSLPTLPNLFAGPRRVAALWNDLDAGEGLVFATPEPGAMTIHFVSVPDFLTERANNFSIRLEAGGRVTVDYDGVLTEIGIVGITEGGGVLDPGASDLSRRFTPFPKAGTTYEVFSLPSAPFDLPFRNLRFQ